MDDDPKLFTADVILSLLLSYRDIQVGGASFPGQCHRLCIMGIDLCPLQDYNAMVKLVEQLPASHEQTQMAPVQVQYAFALNRRNNPGDRDQALGILEKVGGVASYLGLHVVMEEKLRS